MTSIINLKADFAPFGAGQVNLGRSRVFAGGEVDVAVIGRLFETVLLTTRLNTSNDIMELLLVTDAVRRKGVEKVHVFAPYLPYARQDRVVEEGEALAAAVFAKIVNAQQYASFSVFDAHSDVGPALIEVGENIKATEFVRQVLADKQDYHLVAPDAGAEKKVAKYHNALHCTNELVLCTKRRGEGGAIVGTTVSVNDLQGKDTYIVDDICDGGRTFVALAAELKQRNAGKVHLVVSHGIFSNGEQFLKDGGIDHIHTTDSFASGGSEYITRYKLCTILPEHKIQHNIWR